MSAAADKYTQRRAARRWHACVAVVGQDGQRVVMRSIGMYYSEAHSKHLGFVAIGYESWLEEDE